MQVLQVGDPYLGNLLYELPYTSVNFSPMYFTALPNDLPLQVLGTSLGTACTNGTIVPSIDSLMQLYNASDCIRPIPGPITGFQCGDLGNYWSSTSFGPGTHQIVLFADGSQGPKNDRTFEYVRCVNGYSL